MSIEALSFDQIRIFLTVAETGTFSAAAAKLGRVQSAVSYSIRNLEETLQVTLFDRSQKRPQLTAAGHQLLADAQAVDLKMQGLKARAKGMSEGLEANLSIVVDVLYPLETLARALGELARDFPSLPIELHAEALGGTAQLLLDETCQLAILGPLLPEHTKFETTPLDPITLVPVCALSHPLADIDRPITQDQLADHTQLVLSDRSDLTAGQDFAVQSHQTWRLGDIGAKRELLRAGLGWGFLPLHMVKDDLAASRLTELQLASAAASENELSFSLAYRRDAPPGPGGRRLMEILQT